MNRERAKELLPIIEHYANGGDVELRFKNHLAGWRPFVGENVDKGFNPDRYEYRIAQVPDKFTNWDILPKDYRWMTRSSRGSITFWVRKPFLNKNETLWVSGNIEDDLCDITIEHPNNFKDKFYQKGTVDWKNSLIEREE